jgi:hypothetical protein
MRKIFLSIIFLLAVVLLLFSESRIHATPTMNIRAVAWYNWWDPVWDDGTQYAPPYHPGGQGLPWSTMGSINEFKTVSSGMYGPALSLSFLDRWSISSIFLMGKFKSKSEGFLLQYKLFPMYDSEYVKDITRADSDSTIGCRVHKFVKIFIGFKYQWYEYDEKLYYMLGDLGSTNIGLYAGDGYADFKRLGPALGLGLSFPLHKYLFLNINLAGGHFWNTASYNYRYLYFINDIFGTPSISPDSIFLKWYKPYRKEHLRSISANISLAFSYVIPKTSLTLSVGGRYQVLHFYYQKENHRKFIFYEGKYDHFYGITMSVIYSFRLGKGK